MERTLQPCTCPAVWATWSTAQGSAETEGSEAGRWWVGCFFFWLREAGHLSEQQSGGPVRHTHTQLHGAQDGRPTGIDAKEGACIGSLEGWGHPKAGQHSVSHVPDAPVDPRPVPHPFPVLPGCQDPAHCLNDGVMCAALTTVDGRSSVLPACHGLVAAFGSHGSEQGWAALGRVILTPPP